MLSKVLNTMKVPVRSDGQPYLLGAQPVRIEEALFVGVIHDGAGVVHRQHIARRQAVARAAIDDHHLVLTDDGDAVGDRDDATVGLPPRRTGNEVKRHIDPAGEQFIAGSVSRADSVMMSVTVVAVGG